MRLLECFVGKDNIKFIYEDDGRVFVSTGKFISFDSKFARVLDQVDGREKLISVNTIRRVEEIQ